MAWLLVEERFCGFPNFKSELHFYADFLNNVPLRHYVKVVSDVSSLYVQQEELSL